MHLAKTARPAVQNGVNYVNDSIEDFASMLAVSPHSVLRACKQSARQNEIVLVVHGYAEQRAKKEPISADSFSEVIAQRVHTRLRLLDEIHAQTGTSTAVTAEFLRISIALWFD